MKRLPRSFEVVFLLLLGPLASCASPGQAGRPAMPATPRTMAGEEADSPRIVRPGAPGEPTQLVHSSELAGSYGLPHAQADIEFMQGMIPHHAQALDMAALVEERTENQDIRLLARRIEISQKDEISLMGRWLAKRGEEVPGEHAHHMMGDHLMPGMLTPEDFAELGAAKGAEFDRLFLAHMVRHHEGALTMVRALFSSPGAGQETDMFNFASHVDADQQIEIRRMRQMLAAGG